MYKIKVPVFLLLVAALVLKAGTVESYNSQHDTEEAYLGLSDTNVRSISINSSILVIWKYMLKNSKMSTTRKKVSTRTKPEAS